MKHKSSSILWFYSQFDNLYWYDLKYSCSIFNCMMVKKRILLLTILNKCLILRCLDNISHFKYLMFLNEVFFHFFFHLFNIDWDIWFLIKLNDMEIFSVFDKFCPSFATKSAFSLPGISMWPGIHCRFLKNHIFFIILMFFCMSCVIPVLWLFLIALNAMWLSKKIQISWSSIFFVLWKIFKV